MGETSNDWAPPVSFYFEVKFNLTGGTFKSSFMSVDGLDQELVVEEQQQQGETMTYTPKWIKHSNLTLRRPLSPLDDNITKWIRECFNFPYTCRITPCSVTISLLDGGGAVVAAWKCRRVIPLKWSLGALHSDKSEMSAETLTLKHGYLGRIV